MANKHTTRVSMEVSVSNYLVSWFISPIYGTYPTYLYRGYNLFNKYRGHPSDHYSPEVLT